MGRYHTGAGFRQFLAASAALAMGLPAVSLEQVRLPSRVRALQGGSAGHSRAFLCFLRGSSLFLQRFVDVAVGFLLFSDRSCDFYGGVRAIPGHPVAFRSHYGSLQTGLIAPHNNMFCQAVLETNSYGGKSKNCKKCYRHTWLFSARNDAQIG